MEKRMKKRIGTPFQKGNKAAVGPHAPGSGRPPDWLKEKCREVVDKGDLIDFLRKVANGEAVREIQFGDAGVKISAPAEIKDRLKAVEMLLDRGWGKPSQEMEHKGNVTLNIVEVVKQARAERGLE